MGIWKTRQSVILQLRNKGNNHLNLSESIPMANGAFQLEDGRVAILSQGTMTKPSGVIAWDPISGSVEYITSSWGLVPLKLHSTALMTLYKEAMALFGSLTLHMDFTKGTSHYQSPEIGCGDIISKQMKPG